MKPYKTNIRKYQHKKLKKDRLHVAYIRILNNTLLENMSANCVVYKREKSFAQQIPTLNDDPALYDTLANARLISVFRFQ